MLQNGPTWLQQEEKGSSEAECLPPPLRGRNEWKKNEEEQEKKNDNDSQTMLMA